MNEETGITLVGILGIVAAVVLAILLVRNLLNRQNPRPKSGPAHEPNSFE